MSDDSIDWNGPNVLCADITDKDIFNLTLDGFVHESDLVVRAMVIKGFKFNPVANQRTLLPSDLLPPWRAERLDPPWMGFRVWQVQQPDSTH